MATRDLSINFNNHVKTGDDPNSATVDGTRSLGINIYNQIYKSSDMIDPESSYTMETVINILNGYINVVDSGDSNAKLKKEVGTTSAPLSDVKFLSANQGNEQVQITSTFNGTVILDKNQLIIFDASIPVETGVAKKQYYCYFKDKDGNVWLILICRAGNQKTPLIFDLQDDIEPTVNYVNGVVVSISTGNFTLNKATGEGLVTQTELKNTTFNLPIDINSNKIIATVSYMGYAH